ncbi:CaiF/GrlA family transcriptional regulator [Salmonella enterica]|nr:CaiF/GrlA family transcriptional regulator [Salmonella enterica]EBW1593241.1 CaiF/GrlA family transcriptional regulator [Salmonella enterica subsp. diarizonae serovar 61:r:z]EDR7606928.1 CaiF/GrlA family transcriptional regulator [Salmonella enterica subsp. diarizonae]EAT8024286.1 CaiF/GrlA family transcriptional regulator [Salmonella enterica]EBB6123550.1 CaiF/GrlA family transcriptional regulator [Salmonella enterica]
MCPDNTHKKKPHPAGGNDIHYPGQKNHDTCFIPEGVRRYSGEPLYILVAHWCMQQQNWVGHTQISEAFHITAKRASYLVSYLKTKARRVVSICRHQTLPNKVLRYEIFVIQVLEHSPSARPGRTVTQPVTRRRVGNADKAMANELWNRLCRSRDEGKS